MISPIFVSKQFVGCIITNFLKHSTQCSREYHLLVEEGTLDRNRFSFGFPVLKYEEFAGSSFVLLLRQGDSLFYQSLVVLPVSGVSNMLEMSRYHIISYLQIHVKGDIQTISKFSYRKIYKLITLRTTFKNL